MFFRLRERIRPRSRKGRRLSDSLILVGDADKKKQNKNTKNKNKSLNTEVK